MPCREGLIVSALTTKYRDLTQLVTFGLQLFMYATPVIYPLNAAPEKYLTSSRSTVDPHIQRPLNTAAWGVVHLIGADWHIALCLCSPPCSAQ